jgi:hypothetical protein
MLKVNVEKQGEEIPFVCHDESMENGLQLCNGSLSLLIWVQKLCY